MRTSEQPATLVGREAELDIVQRWAGLLSSRPAGLLIAGEAGIGKTSLWAVAVAAARQSGALVLTARPVEAELPMGYAGLGDLLARVVEPILAELPEPMARALSGALSLDAIIESGDPLLVGRATLAALRALAAHSPVVLAIDDVQWLDPASARGLAFVIRRLDDERIGLAASLRDGHADPLESVAALGDRLLRISPSGLSLGAIGRLLRSTDPDIPRRRIVRISERSGGNPFFALQLSSSVDDERLPSSLREMVGRQLAAAPAPAAPAIELAAVLGPLPLAAFEDSAALDAAVMAGVLAEQEQEIRFVHPLLAKGAYDRIPPGRRRALHHRAATLAEGIEARARHQALAAVGPSAETAALLDDAARAAGLRGAPEAAAELISYARRLTPVPDAEARAKRTMDFADYRFLAADEPGARALVDEILASDIHGTTRVRALVKRALFQIEPGPAVARLEEAVAEPHDDRELATRTLAQLAWQRGAWLGDVEPASGEALLALEMAEDLGDDATLVTALTTAGLVMSIAGRPGAADHFGRALAIMDRVPPAAGDHTPRLAFAHERWWRGEFVLAEKLMADERRRAEEHGDEGMLMRLNIFAGELALRRGQWDEAERLLDLALTDARDWWRINTLVRRAILRARRGDRASIADANEISGSPVAAHDPVVAAAGDFALGLIDRAEGRLGEAADRMARLPQLSDRAGSKGPEFAVLIPETVAVLVEADRISDAHGLTAQLERRRAQLEPWGAYAVELCEGLLAMAAGEPADAVERFALAIDGFERILAPWELGQSLYAHGSALRRIGRRLDAAASLERALRCFGDLRAEPAMRRAEEELRRARPRPRHDDTLTAAEARVAKLVSGGRTNREVAAQLFTTVATVEAHLTRIYSKLGIRSRTELARIVTDGSLPLRDQLDDPQDTQKTT
ncbi:MAG: AAA family ATPase [Chloroflexi bacterium]|nr:AAA family ATPase [Chloroflexota bacterium]